jgi:hypothetical protein
MFPTYSKLWSHWVNLEAWQMDLHILGNRKNPTYAKPPCTMLLEVCKSPLLRTCRKKHQVLLKFDICPVIFLNQWWIASEWYYCHWRLISIEIADQTRSSLMLKANKLEQNQTNRLCWRWRSFQNKNKPSATIGTMSSTSTLFET